MYRISLNARSVASFGSPAWIEGMIQDYIADPSIFLFSKIVKKSTTSPAAAAFRIGHASVGAIQRSCRSVLARLQPAMLMIL